MQDDELKSARQELTAIAALTYPPTSFEIAAQIWNHDLNDANPLWNHLDARCHVIDDDRGRAHVIAFTDQRLPSLGLVGYFACTMAEAGKAVLLEARRQLGRSSTTIYGPVNGTITRDYRLNMADDVLFAGEPVTPAIQRTAFAEAGFATYNRYATGRADKTAMNSLVGTSHLTGTKYVLRPFGAQTFLEDLREYHDLMNAIFPQQSIYCPEISFDERVYNFANSPHFDGRFSFFVDTPHQNTPVGFVVAYPHNDHLILKTVGILPEHRRTRVFAELMRVIHQNALDLGLEGAYYGIVREGNEVSKMTRPGVSVIRNYATVSASSLH